MKIITLGTGFVANHLPYEQITARIGCNQDQIRSILEHKKPDVLVNCLGKTGRPNIDSCESNRSETYLANVTLPSLLAIECERLGIHLIHMGSGCIYFGDSPNSMAMGPTCGPSVQVDTGWLETDHANPKSYYSKTKYSCDLILGQMANVTTLRLRMPISSKNDPRNFINKIRGYSQVIDIPNSMTMMDDLTRCVDWAAKESKFGIYHVTNPQPLSAAGVMREFQKYHPEHKFTVISEEQLDGLVKAKRSNCILNTDKLNQAGFQMTPSRVAIEKCMSMYVKKLQ